MAKRNSKIIRADPDFAIRVEKIMELDHISERAATFKIEKQLKEVENKLKKRIRF